MQPHVDDCEVHSGMQSAIALPCDDAVSNSAPTNSSVSLKEGAALQNVASEGDANNSQVLGALLGLCQASIDVPPTQSATPILSDSGISSWTKHFSLQELTSNSAEHSIFSPHSGPFPGDGPTVYQTLDRHSIVSKELQLPRVSVLVHPNLTIQNATLDESSSAVKRERDNLEEAPNFQTKISDDAFMRRLMKMRHNMSQNSAKNDNSTGSGGLTVPFKFPKPISLKQPCDSPFFISNCPQESSCNTSDGASPVVDIHVPSVCECGTVIVGVWYRNRPYYTRWFRHPRYAALRSMLEQNRCKSKYRPVCGAHATAGLASPNSNKDGVYSDSTPSFQDSVPSGGSCPEPATIGDHAATSILHHRDEFGAVTSSDDLLAPKFMSLLCMLQLVKHLDAVGFMYPSIAADTMAPSSMKLEHVKLSAHIDCERSKGFVQYRWYAADVDDLVKDLTSGDKTAKKVVGCCCLGHWRRKPPGRESSKSSSQMIVSAALNVQNVYSPFELESQQPVSLGSVEAPGVSVVDWETLDQSVWQTTKSLLLLQPDVIEASVSQPFIKDRHVKHSGNLCCGRHCENKVLLEKEKKIAGSDESQKIVGSSMHRSFPSSVDSQPANGTSCAENSGSTGISQLSPQRLSFSSIGGNPSGSPACLSHTVPSSAAAQISPNHESAHAATES